MSAKNKVPVETKVYYALEQLKNRGILETRRHNLSGAITYGTLTRGRSNHESEFQPIVKVLEYGSYPCKYQITWMIENPIETLHSLVRQHLANCEATIDMTKMLTSNSATPTTLLN